jgi:peptide/nickel transport system ATP-binding protein
MAYLEVRDLSIRLGGSEAKHQVLDAVSFSVAAGEVFGLVGESGSGKSTVLRCIAGLYSHWTGDITIDGQPLAAAKSRSRSQLVQMVFQDPYGSLHPRQTVNTQLLEPIRIHKLPDGGSRVVAALEQVGLGSDFRYRYPHQLSGGQRQRVAIARALMLEPRILLLDEPTSALDVSVQAEILNLLRDLQERTGLTYLLVSHDLSVVSHMCARFAVMRGGKIVEIATRDALEDSAAATNDYTRVLVETSRRYDRNLATELTERGFT